MAMLMVINILVIMMIATPFTEINNDSIVHKTVIVYKQGEILINNEVRNVMRYKSIEENDLFEISSIINGIGSGYSILGSGVAHVGIDCYARVICYTDENQEYLFNNCCDYPNPYPERTFAPLGAEWLYEGYSDGGGYINDCENNCDGNYNLFRVTGEKEYAGKNYAIVERYHRTRDTEWENTGDEIMLYNYDGLFYSDNNWLDHIMTYSTNVSVGDTFRTGAVRDFPKWVGNDMYTYNLPGTSSLQVVTNIEEINIDGQLRKKITYHSLGEFRIGEVIEGIGPLYEGLLGNDIPIPTNGCLPRLLCYRDSLITFENEDCGCEFPIGPTSTLETQTTYFTLSPNPVTDQLYITISDFDIPEEITIFNISGSSQKVLPFHTSIDVSGLPRGMYLIQVGNAVEKFVKY